MSEKLLVDLWLPYEKQPTTIRASRVTVNKSNPKYGSAPGLVPLGQIESRTYDVLSTKRNNKKKQMDERRQLKSISCFNRLYVNKKTSERKEAMREAMTSDSILYRDQNLNTAHVSQADVVACVSRLSTPQRRTSSLSLGNSFEVPREITSSYDANFDQHLKSFWKNKRKSQRQRGVTRHLLQIN